jgi:hypothetical protein
MVDPDPRIEISLQNDYSITVRTADAELQAALDAFRARGVARPVVFAYAGQGEKAARVWQQLEPALKQAGMSLFNAADPRPPRYVVATDAARRLLLSTFGKAASRLFRVPAWPVSYWAVNVIEGGYEATESRTLKDMGVAPGESTRGK